MATENLIDELLADARERMVKSVEAAQHEFSTVRTGRASPALLDRVVVDYYGAMTPLSQLSTISAPEAVARSRKPSTRSLAPEIAPTALMSRASRNRSGDRRRCR